MRPLKRFYDQTMTYDLVNRFYYKKIEEIPTLTKIVLSFRLKKSDLKNLSSSLFALELITGQKGFIIGTQTSNIQLKIKKGTPVGCKVTLRKKHKSRFFFRSIFNVLPSMHNFDGFLIKRVLDKKGFSYEIRDTFTFSELQKKYYLFNRLPKLTVTLITKCRKETEALFLLKSYQFPVFSDLSECSSIGRA